jgi:hypothetical protein
MMSRTQALATLESEDPDAVCDVRAALAWLAGEEGLGTISLLRLQEFLWYVLPLRWPDAGPRVAATLGRVLSLAGLDRYAQVCASQQTATIIAAYAASQDEGLAAYTRAVAASNAAPPDSDLLSWGSVMGPDERAAYEACAAAIELAFTAGELCPGAQGWRTGRAALVDRWLTMPGAGSGDTLLSQISAERIHAWAHGAGQDRGRMAQGLLPRLLEPTPVPANPLPTLGWLLGHATDGLRLTARHYLAPALVLEAADAFGWAGRAGRARQELDVFPLHTLRGMAQHEMGALRRSRTELVLTRTGKLMVADPATRWHIGTAALIGADEGARPCFPAAVREAALLAIVSGWPASLDELTLALTELHTVEGWSATSGQHSPGLPIAQAIGNELYALRHRLWALDLLAGHDDEIVLTADGTAAALSALLARALRPRHHLGM